MAEKVQKTKARKVAAAAARDESAGVALVGTYRARQLAWIKREGVYNWPVTDGDTFDATALGKVGEPRTTVNPKFTFIDLFAGIGGFRLAAEKNGGTCLGYSEINADAIAAYEANYPESRETNYGDITKIRELPKHDFLTGGVPCQSWSIAGRNLGFDDDRGQLWNDALYLLNKSRPRAFLFENVKGLSDPRNRAALDYILARIRAAGYHASYHVLNSFDYGVPQSRVRIYIVGFRDKRHFDAFRLPPKSAGAVRLYDILDDFAEGGKARRLGSCLTPKCAAKEVRTGATSLSTNNNGFNDYFLLNDIRNGETTIHSWDILKTTPREKRICLLLLKNRRHRVYGPLDGNPLALAHFQKLDSSIVQADIDELCRKGILKPEIYRYRICGSGETLTDVESKLLAYARNGVLVPDALKLEKELRKDRIDIVRTLETLREKGEVEAVETRYDFRYTKISTGLFGVNRVFLPSSNIFPTLVASDSCDYVTAIPLRARDAADYRDEFLKEIYRTKCYRRITRQEACRIQGFPTDFILPENRARWMRLIGNSVSVPVIDQLVRAICATGVFGSLAVKNCERAVVSSLRERRAAS